MYSTLNVIGVGCCIDSSEISGMACECIVDENGETVWGGYLVGGIADIRSRRAVSASSWSIFECNGERTNDSIRIAVKWMMLCLFAGSLCLY